MTAAKVPQIPAIHLTVVKAVDSLMVVTKPFSQSHSSSYSCIDYSVDALTT